MTTAVGNPFSLEKSALRKAKPLQINPLYGSLIWGLPSRSQEDRSDHGRKSPRGFVTAATIQSTKLKARSKGIFSFEKV